MKKFIRFIFPLIIVMLLSFGIKFITSTTSSTEEKSNPFSNDVIDISKEDINFLSYNDFMSQVDSQNIDLILYENDCDYLYAKTIDNTYYQVSNPKYDGFVQELVMNDIIVKNFDNLYTKADLKKDVFDFILTTVIIALVVLFFISIASSIKNKSKKDDNMLIMNIKDKAALMGEDSNISIKDSSQNKENKKTFKDIAGLTEVKKDMQCFVDFLKNKTEYFQAGAELPRGVILYGPPGTGKTLLAKAIANEANVPFYSMSGSDFIEMYVGVGPKRVRNLFKEARKNAPSIIFIDEIDAIGGKRGGHDSNGEDRKTLNALLTEMDGFVATDDVIVIAATNRLQDLDKALLRPGRFTYKYCVPLPETPKERLEIINLYAKNKKFDESVSFENLSKETIGFSPSGIKDLLNDAAIISIQDKKKYIDNESIEKAMFKSLMSGHMKENQKDRDKEELELVAWHEAGHALIGKMFGKDVSKVTILSSTSGAGGVTFSIPTKNHLLSRQDLENNVVELYGGRIAEYMLYNDVRKITTGASNDIEKATEIIKEIVTNYGMTEDFGLLNLEQLGVKQDVIIEKEVELSKQLEQKATDILKNNLPVLKKIANALLEKQTIYAQDLDEIMQEIA